MSKAKPTHMRPILEDVVDAGVISPELRKAIKWSLVTIDDLTQRLAAAEAERDEYKRLWKDACRVKDVRRVAAKGGRDE